MRERASEKETLIDDMGSPDEAAPVAQFPDVGAPNGVRWERREQD
jgi:hypothetical protein